MLGSALKKKQQTNKQRNNDSPQNWKSKVTNLKSKPPHLQKQNVIIDFECFEQFSKQLKVL